MIHNGDSGGYRARLEYKRNLSLVYTEYTNLYIATNKNGRGMMSLFDFEKHYKKGGVRVGTKLFKKQ